MAKLPDPITVTFSSGASSTVVPRLDLIPYRALVRLASRCERGLAIHKERAWNAAALNQSPLLDRDFIEARILHAINHAYRLLDKLRGRAVPNPSDDDAAAIFWAGMFLTESEEEHLRQGKQSPYERTKTGTDTKTDTEE